TATIDLVCPNKTNCPPDTFDVGFTDTGRVLVWDPNCNNVYQIDLGSSKQLTTETIDTGFALGEEGLLAPDLINQLSYSRVHQRGYLCRDGEVLELDPAGLTSSI